MQAWVALRYAGRIAADEARVGHGWMTTDPAETMQARPMSAMMIAPSPTHVPSADRDGVIGGRRRRQATVLVEVLSFAARDS